MKPGTEPQVAGPGQIPATPRLIAEIVKQTSPVVQGRGMVRIPVQGHAVIGNSLIKGIIGLIGQPPVEEVVRIFGAQGVGLGKILPRQVIAGLFQETNPSVVKGLSHGPILFQTQAIVFDGLVVFAHLQIDSPKIIQDLGVVGILPQGPVELGQGLVVFFQLGIGPSPADQGLDQVLIERQGPGVILYGLSRLSEPAQTQTHVVIESSVFRTSFGSLLECLEGQFILGLGKESEPLLLQPGTGLQLSACVQAPAGTSRQAEESDQKQKHFGLRAIKQVYLVVLNENSVEKAKNPLSFRSRSSLKSAVPANNEHN